MQNHQHVFVAPATADVIVELQTLIPYFHLRQIIPLSLCNALINSDLLPIPSIALLHRTLQTLYGE